MPRVRRYIRYHSGLVKEGDVGRPLEFLPVAWYVRRSWITNSLFRETNAI